MVIRQRDLLAGFPAGAPQNQLKPAKPGGSRWFAGGSAAWSEEARSARAAAHADGGADAAAGAAGGVERHAEDVGDPAVHHALAGRALPRR